MKNQLTQAVTALMLSACALLSGCVAPVAKSVSTQSGKPEVVIAAELPRVKSAIIGKMVGLGYTVEQDSDYMLRMSRPLDSTENFVAALAVGNSYSENRRVSTFAFVKLNEGVRVIASSMWQAQMPGGQIHAQELADDGRYFNRMQADMEAMKRAAEAK